MIPIPKTTPATAAGSRIRTATPDPIVTPTATTSTPTPLRTVAVRPPSAKVVYGSVPPGSASSPRWRAKPNSNVTKPNATPDEDEESESLAGEESEESEDSVESDPDSGDEFVPKHKGNTKGKGKGKGKRTPPKLRHKDLRRVDADVPPFPFPFPITFGSGRSRGSPMVRRTPEEIIASVTASRVIREPGVAKGPVSRVGPVGLNHPAELALPNPLEWENTDIIQWIANRRYDIPPASRRRPVLGSVITISPCKSSPSGIVKPVDIQVHYRTPLLWATLWLWHSIKLVLTSPLHLRDSQWSKYRLSILQVARQCEALLKHSRRNIGQRCTSFDRQMIRFKEQYHESTEEEIWEFHDCVGEGAYKDVVALDDFAWTNLKCMNGPHADPIRLLDSDRAKKGLTGDEAMKGIVFREGKWLYDANAARVVPPNSASTQSTAHSVSPPPPSKNPPTWGTVGPGTPGPSRAGSIVVPAPSHAPAAGKTASATKNGGSTNSKLAPVITSTSQLATVPSDVTNPVTHAHTKPTPVPNPQSLPSIAPKPISTVTTALAIEKRDNVPASPPMTMTAASNPMSKVDTNATSDPHSKSTSTATPSTPTTAPQPITPITTTVSPLAAPATHNTDTSATSSRSAHDTAIAPGRGLTAVSNAISVSTDANLTPKPPQTGSASASTPASTSSTRAPTPIASSRSTPLPTTNLVIPSVGSPNPRKRLRVSDSDLESESPLSEIDEEVVGARCPKKMKLEVELGNGDREKEKEQRGEGERDGDVGAGDGAGAHVSAPPDGAGARTPVAVPVPSPPGQTAITRPVPISNPSHSLAQPPTPQAPKQENEQNDDMNVDKEDSHSPQPLASFTASAPASTNGLLTDQFHSILLEINKMGPMVQATQAECLELRTSNASLQKDLCAERTKNKEHEALSHTRDAHTRSLMAELALVKGKVKTLEDAKAKLRLDKLEVEARMNKARVAHEKDVDVMKGKMGKMEKEREKERVTHERDIGKLKAELSAKADTELSHNAELQLKIEELASKDKLLFASKAELAAIKSELTSKQSEVAGKDDQLKEIEKKLGVTKEKLEKERKRRRSMKLALASGSDSD